MTAAGNAAKTQTARTNDLYFTTLLDTQTLGHILTILL